MIIGSVLFVILIIFYIVYIANFRVDDKRNNIETEKESDNYKIVETNLNSEKNKEIIRKRIDLHYYKTDFSFLNQYVEYSFYACFYDVFNINDDNSLNENSIKGNGIKNLFDVLDIEYNFDSIFNKYMKRDYRDVDVYYNKNDENTFVYLDLEQEPTDQSNMFFLGISCKSIKVENILPILNEIHSCSGTKSELKKDELNSELYYDVFHSYNHFYDGNYNEHKKQIMHHSN